MRRSGYILIGKDTDGLTMPHDLAWPMRREDEFIGKRALTALAPRAPMLGQGGDVTDATWAAQIARDRALLVGGAPWDVAPGWHAGGYAVAQVGDL